MSEEETFRKIFYKENTHYSIYSALLRHEKDKWLRKKLATSVSLERKHVEVWRDVLSSYGPAPKRVDYKFYPYFFLVLRRLFGKSLTAKALEIYEKGSLVDFLNVINIVPADKLKKVVDVITDELYNEKFRDGDGKPKGLLAHVREIVFGMNDGLVEVLAAVSGLVGIYKSNLLTSLAGLIVGVSGTISMAVGAYLSSTSEKDVSMSEINRIQLEIAAAKERASRELGKNYKSYKILEADLDNLIKKLKENKDPFYKVLEREKSTSLFKLLGKGPSTMEHGKKINPFKDAAYVGIFYLIGAVIPLASFFIGALIHDSVFLNLIISIVAASLVISATSAIIALNTNENAVKRVAQSLSLSLVASGVTFFIGYLVSFYLHIAV